MRIKNSSTFINNGFTLIELVIVIGLLSVLFSFAIFVIDPLAQINKANDARRKSDLALIQKALEEYYQDNGSYPMSQPNNNCSSGLFYKYQTTCAEWGKSWIPYMDKLPIDPDSSRNYHYYSSLSGQAYYIYASLESNSSDPQLCNSGDTCSSAPIRVFCGNDANICNYGVSSPNVSP
ncbi:MAG: prepilin-type N-terminal cleavage/methylation domain-containing protein [Candidatus Levybacteria bacterium]|nr:prepilin-type N-terminal cleavage/methylation domain-containing protein [Candidatus Levybacteria bacterium]